MCGQLLKAASYLSRPGSLFLATNLDAQFPVKGKEIVVPGSIVNVYYSPKKNIYNVHKLEIVQFEFQIRIQSDSSC